MSKKRREDLTGQKFNMLTALEFHKKNESRKTFWYCKCDCGNIVSVRSDQLKSGNTKSCGCWKRKTDAINARKNHTHKMSGTPLYASWQRIKARCFNKNSPDYPDYGGRGITVCDEWKNDFEKYKEWALQNGYEKNLSIDRINNDGNYEPSNCRWADDTQQAYNRRSNVFLEYKGVTKNITKWAEESGINKGTFMTRYYRGYRGDKLFAPVKKRK